MKHAQVEAALPVSNGFEHTPANSEVAERDSIGAEDVNKVPNRLMKKR